MSAAAPPSNILRAVERWARTREWLDDGTPGRVGTMPWLVYMRGAGDVDPGFGAGLRSASEMIQRGRVKP